MYTSKCKEERDRKFEDLWSSSYLWRLPKIEMARGAISKHTPPPVWRATGQGHMIHTSPPGKWHLKYRWNGERRSISAIWSTSNLRLLLRRSWEGRSGESSYFGPPTFAQAKLRRKIWRIFLFRLCLIHVSLSQNRQSMSQLSFVQIIPPSHSSVLIPSTSMELRQTLGRVCTSKEPRH